MVMVVLLLAGVLLGMFTGTYVLTNAVGWFVFWKTRHPGDPFNWRYLVCAPWYAKWRNSDPESW